MRRETLACLAFLGALSALPATRPAGAEDSDLQVRLARAHAGLASDDPAERDTATQNLLNEGVAAASFVREKLPLEKDPEVAARLQLVLEAIEMEEFVLLKIEADRELERIAALRDRLAKLDTAHPERSSLEASVAAVRAHLKGLFSRISERLKDDSEPDPLPKDPAPAIEWNKSHPNIADMETEPKIDGDVLFIHGERPLFLISAGADQKAARGMKFTVYRGSEYVSKLVVVELGARFAVCRELDEFRKSSIRPEDPVSTRVFD